MSDSHLTENCGILDKLLPDDVILADRGFIAQDSVKLFGAYVKLPSFKKGKKQLSSLEIEHSCQISHVMLMCSAEEGYSLMDKVVVICCALCNCCDSIVPFD